MTGRDIMSDAIKLGSVALDCPDAGKLAAFYGVYAAPAGHAFCLSTQDVPQQA